MLDNIHNLEQKQIIVDQLFAAATAFESGSIPPIETARSFLRFYGRDKKLDAFLRPFVGVDSETDALPIGDVRKLWNADALSLEDVKIEAAQRWARPIVSKACDALVEKLNALGLKDSTV